MSILDAAALFLFPILMAYAALSDLFTMTISNAISLLLVGLFVIFAVSTGMPVMAIVENHVSAGFAVLILTFILFALGWIGGGDAKLAAATAMWLGWENLMDYGEQVSLIGGALTFAILYFRKIHLPDVLMSQNWIARLHKRDNGVPYGIALSIAGLLLYPETAVWRAVVGA